MNNIKKWYVIKTISGKENKVKSHIEEIRKKKFQEEIGDILVPIEKVIQMRKGKKIHREKVHYPGYIMIEANLKSEAFHMIKSTPGFITFLGEGRGSKSHPVPMREEEINRILNRINNISENNEIINIPFIVGETIKVIDGPFSGFNGTIEKINEEKKKLELAVLIFGRKTPLELNFTQIEKI